MGKWQNLTAKLKALVIKFAILNGVSNIKDIRDTFNMYADGGYSVNGISLTYARNSNIQPNYNVTSYAGNINSNKIYTFNSHINGVTSSESTVVTPEFANVLLGDNARTFNVGTPEYNYYNDRVKDLQSYNTSPGNILSEVTVTPNGNYMHTQYANGGNLVHKYDGELVGESSALNILIPTMPVDNTYVEIPQPLPITFLPTKGDYKVLDRNALEYFTQQLLEAHLLEIDNAIASLNTRAKVKEVQTQLAEAGAYDKYLPTKKEDIKKIQRRLITLGFLPEEINGRKLEDGIIGKNTINAWRKANIDGILGLKTKDEYKKTFDTKDDADWGISVDGLKDYCARFVSNKIEAVTGLSTKTLGAYGNGWNMLTNIVKQGGTELFNIYKNDSFKNISSVQELKLKTSNYLSLNSIDYSKLETGDVVGIYIPSSFHHKDVLETGSTYNTHIGIIVGMTEKGEPIVEHTINNKVYQDPISNIRGNVGKGKAQITVAARPNYTHTISKIKLDEQAVSRYSIDLKYANEHISNFMKGMAEGELAILQIYPEVPMDIVLEIAIAVQKRETNFMTNRVSDQGFIAKTKDAIATKIRGEERKSTNTSKMKLSSLTPYERAFLDIHSKEDLEDPKKAGLAAELYLAKNYDYFKRLQLKYPELGITDEDIKAAVILSYNLGMSKLYSLGFDSNGNIAKLELEELRKLADINTRIRDVSSTNYRFLGDLGEALYNKFEDPQQPYISAALEASNKYVHRNTFGGSLHKKSTGGPLYPFSFEKNPLLKTPVVRYDEGGLTYTVKKGDTFSLIALNVGVSVEDLQKLNPTITNVNKIREGLSINIPPYMFSEIFNTPQVTGLINPQTVKSSSAQSVPKLEIMVPIQKGLKTAGPLDLQELAVRQAYTESRLRPEVVNDKGAYGLFQIMLPALDDYNRVNKTNYTLEDMKDADNNIKVRNWYMNYLSNLGFINKGDIQSDSVGMYKVLASFNAGAGNVKDALTKAKADGKDIYDSWDWVSYLWDEPREYADFILRGIETRGTNKNDSVYKAVSKAKSNTANKIRNSIK